MGCDDYNGNTQYTDRLQLQIFKFKSLYMGGFAARAGKAADCRSRETIKIAVYLSAYYLHVHIHIQIEAGPRDTSMCYLNRFL